MSPGDVLGGKYVVERVLGRGGMGEVVVARHSLLGERVAIKTLLASADRGSAVGGTRLVDRDAIERFLNEARASIRIRSEHVVRVSDVDLLPSGQPFMVMELLEGRDLEARLAEGPFSIAEAVDLLLQACEGVAEAHRLGIVHRDLKPGNMFLTGKSDGSTRLVLLDFGISKFVDGPGAHGLTATQGLMGSPVYMSPEQFQNPRDVDARTDVWALGVILFRMLAGRPPFVAESLPALVVQVLQQSPPGVRSLRPDVPPLLEGLIAQCLHKRREQRISSVAALGLALAPFASRDGARVIERLQHMSGSVPQVPVATAAPATGAVAQTGPVFGGSPMAETRAVASPTVLMASVSDLSLSPVTQVGDTPTTVGTNQPASRAGLFVGLGIGAVAVVAVVLAFTLGGSPSTPAAQPSVAKESVKETIDEPEAKAPKKVAKPAPSPAVSEAAVPPAPTVAPGKPPIYKPTVPTTTPTYVAPTPKPSSTITDDI